jgi:benzoate/toluate 1,2-dioxygenase beta subunit
VSEALDLDLLREVEQFVYLEARLADELRYDEWESLWTDDAVYWVPSGADDIDPNTQMSIIFDNRSRIGTRIRQ